MNIGKHIRSMTIRKNVSVRSLAKASKISEGTMCEIVNNDRSITPLVSVSLGKALGLEPDYLMNLQMKNSIKEVRSKYRDRIRTIERI